MSAIQTSAYDPGRTRTAHTARRGAGYWCILLVGLLCVLFGLPILVLGLWLIAEGGSWYYAPAGLGLTLTGVLLFRLSTEAVWVYLLTFLGTVLWAFWEKGFDGWAQVPRLVAPTVVLVLVLAVLPSLQRRDPRGD